MSCDNADHDDRELPLKYTINIKNAEKYLVD